MGHNSRASQRIFSRVALLVALGSSSFLCSVQVHAESNAEVSVWKDRKSAWAFLSETERAKLETFSEDYRRFLQEARTESLAVAEIEKRALAKGYKPWSPEMVLKTGERFFVSIHHRSVILIRIGKEPIEQGIRMIAAHIDSPRLEIKGRPVYEEQKVVLLNTRIHGGIKNYQFVNVPLALVGEIRRMDGSVVSVRTGLDPKDPVLVIPDAAIHEDKEIRDVKYPFIKSEDLDPVVGLGIFGKNPLSEILGLLKTQFQIQEEDFVGAELALVPAMAPREAGFDRSMILAYGQDDKSSAYGGVRAILDQEEVPKQTLLVYLTDNEESGSQNNTGAESLFLRETIQELLSRQGNQRPEALYQTLRNSIAISADATTGINPTYVKKTQEETNASRLGYGVVVKLYASSKDADPKTYAQFRNLFVEHQIPWQTQTPHGDVGGGSTIGVFLSRQGIEVIDLGIPLLSMHAPYELTAKVDVYYLYKAMQAFASMPNVFKTE